MTFDGEPIAQTNEWDAGRIRSLQEKYSITSTIQLDIPVRREGTAGNAFAITPDHMNVIRVTQHQSDDIRLGSSAILAEIQKMDPRVLVATPKVISIGKAIVNELQSKLVELRPISSQNGKLATIVEYFKASDGWEITSIPFVHSRDGMLKIMLGQPETIQLEQLDIDCRRNLEALHQITRLQSSLSDHGVILRDYKGSYAVKSDEQGLVTEMKVLDIDEIETRFDKKTRDEVAIGDMIGFGFGLSSNEPIVEVLENALAVNPSILTDDMKRMLHIDYLMWLTRTSDDELKAAGITDSKISLRELLSLTQKYLSNTLPSNFDARRHIQQRKLLRDARKGLIHEMPSTPQHFSTPLHEVQQNINKVRELSFESLLKHQYGVESEGIAAEIKHLIALEQFEEVQKVIKEHVKEIPPQITWFLEQYNSSNMGFHAALWNLRSDGNNINPGQLFQDLLYALGQNEKIGQLVTDKMALELQALGKQLAKQGVEDTPNILRRAGEASNPTEVFRIEPSVNPHDMFKTPTYQ